MKDVFDGIVILVSLTFCEQYGDISLSTPTLLKKIRILNGQDCGLFVRYVKRCYLKASVTKYKQRKRNSCIRCVLSGKGLFRRTRPKKCGAVFFEKDLSAVKRPRDVQYAPERILPLHWVKYAPGRFVTIDKKIFKSGGIYANPRRKALRRIKRNFIQQPTKYYKISISALNATGWAWKRRCTRSACPYCGADVVSNHMLRPWAFLRRGDE